MNGTPTPKNASQRQIGGNKRLPRVSKTSVAKVKRELWEVCRKIVFFLYGNDCYTCDATNLQGSNRQCGHLPWPKSILPSLMKYDIRLLRTQCGRCNIWLSGNQVEGYKRMVEEIGQIEMDKLDAERRKVIPASIIDWLNRLEEYKKLLEKCV